MLAAVNALQIQKGEIQYSKCAESTVNPLPFPWPGVLQVTVTSETKQMTNCKALGEPDYVYDKGNCLIVLFHCERGDIFQKIFKISG